MFTCLMPPTRIELVTFSLQERCAANCATEAYRWRDVDCRIRTYAGVAQLVSNQSSWPLE